MSGLGHCYRARIRRRTVVHCGAGADARLSALVDNAEFLPDSVCRRVRHLHEAYVRQCAVARRDPSVAQQLAGATMSALEEIRVVLSDVEPGGLAA